MTLDINKKDFWTINDWADFWHFQIGANVIPADTKEKASFIKWSQHQYKEISGELHEERKKKNEYDNGIAVITGLLWRGQFQGKFLLAIDLDNKKAIDEFVKDKLPYYKERTLVEQHANPDKMHLYFIVDRELNDKARDVLKSDKIENNEVPGIEVKATPKRMMCCASSPHKNGSNYQIKGTLKPQLFSADEIEEQITGICDKFGIPYGPNNNEVNSDDNNRSWKSSTRSTVTATTPLPEELRKIIILLGIPDNFEYKILEGSRHAIMLSFANSLLIKHRDYSSRDKLKELFFEVNDKICSPPLPDNEIKIIWRDAIKFAEDKIKKIEILNNDENDSCNFNSQIVVTLDQGDRLLEEEIVQNFVYDIQANSVYLDLNHKYENSKNIIPVNIKKWDEVRKTFEKLLTEKKISLEHIQLLKNALDKNFDLIKQKFLESYRKHTAAQAASEQRRAERQRLIEEGTNFLMQKYTFKTIEKSKDILYYDHTKGVYVYGGEILIEKELDKKYGFGLKTADITEITNYVIRKTYVKKSVFDKDLDIINVKNYLLNWKTGQRIDHTPDYLSLNQKPIIYNPKAVPRKFIKFLKEVLYLKDTRTAVEIIAYTFIRKNIWELYFILLGSGSNGKNVFVEILSRLHGHDNVSNIPWRAFEKHTFVLGRLVNKDVNIDIELSSNAMSILKKLTGSVPVMVEDKGKDPYFAELWAKLFFNCNELPQNLDNSDAQARRRIILPFRSKFEVDPKKDDPNVKVADPFVLDKIVNDGEEMSGILNLIINSLRTIDRNKKIHVNSTTAERQEKVELLADPIGAFYDRYCMQPADPKVYERGEVVYAVFTKFLNKNTIHIPSYTDFYGKLRRGYGVSKGRAREPDPDNPGKELRPRVWFNIHLFTEEEIQKMKEEGKEVDD